MFRRILNYFTRNTLRPRRRTHRLGSAFVESLEPRLLLASIQILDDSEAGFTTSGLWAVAPTYAGWVNNNVHYTQAGSQTADSVASWAFDDLAPGRYRVSGTWQPYATGRASDAPYQIYAGSELLSTVHVDQRPAPIGFSDAGVTWQPIGGDFYVSGGSLTVQLSNQANGFVVADAVRIELLGELPAGAQLQVFESAEVLNGSGLVPFDGGSTGTFVGDPVTKTFTVRNVGGSPIAPDAEVQLPAGYSLISGPQTTPLGPLEKTTFSVRLDAEALGTYAGEVVLTSGGEPRFQFLITGDVTPWKHILDDSSTGFMMSGTWGVAPAYAGWVNNNLHYTPTGSNNGNSVASWTFDDLEPGRYRVSATWEPYANGRASDAPYQIYAGSELLSTVRVDQRPAPAGFSDAGATWQQIGGDFYVGGGSLVVQLSNQANGFVVADAVRLEREGDLPTAARIQVFETAEVLDGTGLVPFDTGTFVGDPVTKTLTVWNVSSSAIMLDAAVQLPDGYSLISGPQTTSLGPLEKTTFSVRLDAQALGTYAGEVVLTSGGEPCFQFQITGSVIPWQRILDDAGTGFTVSGTWGVAPAYAGWVNDNLHYTTTGSDTADSVASWMFDDVEPGRYRVSATWRPYAIGRASDAPYQIYAGNELLSTLRVDQRLAPAGFSDAGVMWQQIGGDFYVGDGSLTVKLSNQANGFVVADAVRIERVGELPAGAQLQVFETAEVLNGTGVVPFVSGSTGTFVGNPVTKTFTVWNVGDSPIALDAAVHLPAGYNLISGPQTTPLGLLEKTTFSVRLDAEALGTYAGEVVLTSGGELRFQFLITGEVIPWKRILDDSGTGFTTSGTWAVAPAYAGWVSNNLHYTLTGSDTGNSVAAWTFDGLEPGRYRVSATWRPYTTGRASDAPYQIYAGSELLSTLRVDQRPTPTGFSDAGIMWQQIGGDFYVGGGSLTVKLSNQANGYVVADAIRLERVDNHVHVSDNFATGFSTVGNWKVLSHTSGWLGSNVHYSFPGNGESVGTWTFPGLPAGLYSVSAAWTPYNFSAKNAPFTIHINGMAAGTYAVNQTVAPNDVQDLGINWEYLGGMHAVHASDVLTVSLSNAANKWVFADAIRVERIGDLPSQPSIQVFQTEEVVHAVSTVAFDDDRWAGTFVGSPITKTFTVRNVGSEVLTLTNVIDVPAGFSLVSGFSQESLQPNGWTTFEIRLDAEHVGDIAGNISFVADGQSFSIQVRGHVIPPPSSMISVRDQEDVDTLRASLIESMWGADGFPGSKLPSIEEFDVSSPLGNLTNLAKVDRHTVTTDGFTSVIYHFHPQQANDRLAIFQQGHNPQMSGDGGLTTIQTLLNEGYAVMALQMPLFGPNSGPYTSYNAFLADFTVDDFNVYLAPIAAAVNYARTNYDYAADISLIGVSGGGWTVTLYAALDPSIARTVSVSGGLPQYLDLTMNLPQFLLLYDLVDSLDLYILASAGAGRKYMQVFNRFDNCCFAGKGYQTYVNAVSTSVSSLPGGEFSTFLDETHIDHKISAFALDLAILPFLL